MPNSVKPEMITWARKRAGMKPADLADEFTRLSSWEDGSTYPTSKELFAFALAVHVPLGYLLCETPPDESLPIKDFRSFSGGTNPSLEVRDTIDACFNQRDWYKGYLLDAGHAKLDFVGSAKLRDAPEVIARKFAARLDFDLRSARRKKGNLDEAFSSLKKKAVELGVLVNVNNVVLNTKRKLDANEFRGFALSDEYAPLVFINSADSKSGQIFTLAHELGHILLGKSALDDGSRSTGKDKQGPVEVWCNRFAAELLVPIEQLRRLKKEAKLNAAELTSIACYFNVSRQVILLRLRNNGMIGKDEFDSFWKKAKSIAERDAKKKKEAEKLARKKGAKGPDYYTLVISRYGKGFTEALCKSANDGETLYRDAMHLLGVSNPDTITKLHLKLQKTE